MFEGRLSVIWLYAQKTDNLGQKLSVSRDTEKQKTLQKCLKPYIYY